MTISILDNCSPGTQTKVKGKEESYEGCETGQSETAEDDQQFEH